MKTNLPLFLFLIIGLTLSGCSNIHPYEGKGLAENITLTPEVKTGSMRMDLYGLDEKCQGPYQGSVQPVSGPEKFGLPVNQLYLLKIIFMDASFLGGSHSMATGVFLRPQPGVNYEVKATYADSIYNVEVRQRDNAGRWQNSPKPNLPKSCSK